MKTAKKRYLSMFHIVLPLLFFCIFTQNVWALIPEPENIIYGTAPLEGEIISLKIGDQEIASYLVEEHPETAGFYVLRVSVESFDPLVTAVAQPEDIANLYVDNVVFIDPDTGTSLKIVIGNRGTVQLFNLDLVDSDGDGLLDRAEIDLGTNMFNTDTDGDGLLDGDDINPLKTDHDGDGFDDYYEIIAGTNPDDEYDMPVVYVDQANATTSPPPDGTQEHPYPTIEEGVLGAEDFYTVVVAAGVYPETLTLTKELRLVGASPMETIIDGGNALSAIEYTGITGVQSRVEFFTIKNAGIGILAGTASPLIKNNVLTGMSVSGVSCDVGSAARIINNTIAGNPSGSGITSLSGSVTIVNNIISHNNVGLSCIGVSELVQAYNNVWANSLADTAGCDAEPTNISVDPKYADMGGGDFRLYLGSAAIDSGDPVEILTSAYSGTTIVELDDVSYLASGDRVWITNGTDEETSVVKTMGSTDIVMEFPFMNDYEAITSHIYTTTSFCGNEPETTRDRIDLGAYGNTPASGGFVWVGDLNTDTNVDLVDLILAMKVLTNSKSPGTKYTGDVGGDERIGIPEVLYILENASR